MTDARFKIVFTGELMPAVTLDTVKDNLARLFKSDRSKIDGLFSGNAVALKRDLTESEADKYLAALQNAGAKVRKEPDLAASLSLVETDGHRTSAPESVPGSDSMTCPKCGHEQPTSVDCEACGIVIEKYLARHAQLAGTTTAPSSQAVPVVASTTDPSPYATPQAQVGEVLPEFGELNVFTTDGRIGRLRYLAWYLLLSLGAVALFAIAAMGFAMSQIIGGVLIAAVTIGMVVVAVQMSVQRLHDIGWSGWLLLLSIVPIIGSVFSLLMLVVPGSTGANRFGPPQPANSTAVKVLAALWLVPILALLIAVFVGGIGMFSELGGELGLPSSYSESASDTAEGYSDYSDAAEPATSADAADAEAAGAASDSSEE
ncbi:DUF805 domain-containing protein [Pseudomonas cavernicola]|uniref:DUF805 domain-containing protein n=1 Tax=Pseudomonas cavernicola TaxID=2320866 RepID=A0A418XII5_9PSED|nr:DUF805 domain-containing protein [Pseudomonas cavernicola]RJG12247.1 DUF805 domain-containing protein [Pseudomonas cavernicola]